MDGEGPWRWWSLNFILKLDFGCYSWLARMLSWGRGEEESTFYCFTFAFPRTIVLGFKENSFPSFEHISNVLFGLSHILPAATEC